MDLPPPSSISSILPLNLCPVLPFHSCECSLLDPHEPSIHHLTKGVLIWYTALCLLWWSEYSEKSESRGRGHLTLDTFLAASVHVYPSGCEVCVLQKCLRNQTLQRAYTWSFIKWPSYCWTGLPEASILELQPCLITVPTWSPKDFLDDSMFRLTFL